MTKEETAAYMREYRQTHKAEIAARKKLYHATKEGRATQIRGHKKQDEKRRKATALRRTK